MVYQATAIHPSRYVRYIKRNSALRLAIFPVVYQYHSAGLTVKWSENVWVVG